MIIYSCHGAAKQVTGSCHLVTCNDRRVLIDCGLFQGSEEVERANAEPFGFDPAGIEADSGAHVRGHELVVAGDDLHGHALVGEEAQGRHGDGCVIFLDGGSG